MNVCDYTTIYSVRTLYLDATGTADDALLLSLIRQVTREIEDITNRRFYPRAETRLYDTPAAYDLIFDGDLLEVTALTNGNGAAIEAADYVLYPLNATPKQRLSLLPTATTWQLKSGNPHAAITLAGVWGYSSDYAEAWEDVGAALEAGINASVTSLTATAGVFHSGDLVQIDDEMLYVTQVTSADAQPDTLTARRGVNGSTAAAHLADAAISRWNPGSEIQQLAARAAVAYYKLRSNPTAETINVDGVTFSTPKDVAKWLGLEISRLGLGRVGFA